MLGPSGMNHVVYSIYQIYVYIHTIDHTTNHITSSTHHMVQSSVCISIYIHMYTFRMYIYIYTYPSSMCSFQDIPYTLWTLWTMKPPRFGVPGAPDPWAEVRTATAEADKLEASCRQGVRRSAPMTNHT